MEIVKEAIPRYLRYDLGDNKITDKGAGYISKGSWPQLQLLQISRNFGITDKGFNKLVLGYWPSLLAFYFRNGEPNIGGTNISERGMMKLIECNWPNICRISLPDNS